MALWLAFLIGDPQPGPRRTTYDGVLARAALDEMFTPLLPARDGEGASGTEARTGLSCFVERHQGVEVVGHSGDQHGFISHLYLHRPSASGYVVSFNTNAQSKTDPRLSTRAVDNALRDAIIREIWRSTTPIRWR
jgi:hypothetical protein